MPTSRSILGLLLALTVAGGAGCTGINASKSVSPIDFLLPGVGGLLKADPPKSPATDPTLPAALAGTNEVASVR